MRVNEYHQPEDVEAAKANGISYNSFYNRVYNLGWSIKRAIHTPIKKRSESLWYQYRDLCEEHGVHQHMFFQRIYAGWGEQNAATLPPGTKYIQGQPKLTPSLISLAQSRGISRFTLHARVHRYKWDLERALTEPIHTQFRRKL